MNDKIIIQTIAASFIGLLFIAPAPAETLTYSSGTGFFINRDGYLLTNNHVIEHCEQGNQITVYGAVSLANAEVVARDADYDLALLRTTATVTDAASLNSEKQPVRIGDPVVVVGYPGQSWEVGEPTTREAKILDTKGPRGEEKWMGFSDALAQGNSGGPLLDSAGNVVGVVVAKAHLYTYNEAAAREETVKNFDIAITLPVVRKFLDDNGARYQDADSGIYLSSDRVTDIAKHFVVNVRCRVD